MLEYVFDLAITVGASASLTNRFVVDGSLRRRVAGGLVSREISLRENALAGLADDLPKDTVMALMLL